MQIRNTFVFQSACAVPPLEHSFLMLTVMSLVSWLDAHIQLSTVCVHIIYIICMRVAMCGVCLRALT